MNERQLDILTLLVKYPDYKIGNLEKELGLTRRQINYALDQLNSLFKDNSIPSIVRNKAGDFFIPLEVTQMFVDGNAMDSSDNEFLSDSERKDIIIIYLIISNHFVSLNHLIDLTLVSKSTAMKDIKYAESFVEQYDLKIEYTRENGYEILGEETKIRIILNDLISTWGTRLEKLKIFSEYLDVKEDDIIHFISKVESHLNIKYSSDSFKLLVKLIRYSIARIKSNRDCSQSETLDQVNNTEEFNIVKKLIPTDWAKSDFDIEWLTLLFLLSNVYKSSNNIMTDHYLEKLIVDMVETFELKTLISIENKSQFTKQLYAHMKPAIYRIKFNVSLEHYNIKTIFNEKQHSLLISLIKDLVKPLEKELMKPFPNDELHLLSFYFGSQLEDKNKLLDFASPKAVTVCANGLISSNMMKETLQRLFPELTFLSAISEREFYDYEADYDIVFTTTVLKTTIQQFQVSTIMSNEEQLRLRYNVFKKFNGLQAFENYSTTVKSILNVIEKYAHINDKENLTSGIKEILFSESHGESKVVSKNQPLLSDYIQEELIVTYDKPLNWEESIELAMAPLVVQNYIAPGYVSRVTDIIRQTNYMFLGSKIVIPHAESQGDIYKEGISILISKEPILFPNDRWVDTVVPIAITDTSKHLYAMNQLSELSENEQILNDFKTMTQSEIHNYIERME